MGIGYAVSFYGLSLALKELPLGVAYAIWSGVGTALTAVLGILIFDEPLSIGMILGILCIIGGVALMNSPAGETDDRSLEQET